MRETGSEEACSLSTLSMGGSFQPALITDDKLGSPRLSFSQTLHRFLSPAFPLAQKKAGMCFYFSRRFIFFKQTERCFGAERFSPYPASCVTSFLITVSVLRRLNGSHFDGDKALPGAGSRELDEEEGEELVAEEEEAERGESARKPNDEGASSNLDHDVINDDMDFEGADDLELNSKSSPRRYASKTFTSSEIKP